MREFAVTAVHGAHASERPRVGAAGYTPIHVSTNQPTPHRVTPTSNGLNRCSRGSPCCSRSPRSTNLSADVPCRTVPVHLPIDAVRLHCRVAKWNVLGPYPLLPAMIGLTEKPRCIQQRTR